MASESVQPELDDRTIRAATQHMTVYEEGHAIFEVTTESGRAYTVDLRQPACTCPDYSHREAVTECKHIRRVRLEVGQVDIGSLAAEFASRAEELEEQAADLNEKAQKLTRKASEYEKAIDRLQEVIR